MAKNDVVKKYKEELDDDYDLYEEITSPEDTEIAGMMSSMIEVSQHQQVMAIELTRLVIEKSSTEKMTEEKIFSVFKQASQVLCESFPLKELWEKFS